MTERQIHEGFNVWLREQQVPYIESRMDRKSTIEKSWPDYTVLWMGHAVCIEVKTAQGRLRPEQVSMIEYIRRSGNKVEVCRSVPECVEAVRNILMDGRAPFNETPVECDQWPLQKKFRDLKRAVAAVPVNGNGTTSAFSLQNIGLTAPEPTPSGPNLFIGSMHGRDWAFRKLDKGNLVEPMHVADSHDLATIPRG